MKTSTIEKKYLYGFGKSSQIRALIAAHRARRNEPVRSTVLIPVGDSKAARNIREGVMAANRRLKNWDGAEASRKNGGYCAEAFSYRGNYRGYTGYKYYAYVRSTATVYGPHARTAIVAHAHTAKRINAPKGWEFAIDYIGFCIRREDNHDYNYHPSSADAIQGGRALRKLAVDLKRRRNKYAAEQKNKARLAAAEKRLRERAEKLPAESVLVFPIDSTRAGNCATGTADFVARFAPDGCLRADRLLVVADRAGLSSRARLAVYQARLRTARGEIMEPLRRN